MSASKDNILINSDKRIFYLSDNVDNLSIGQMCFNLLYILNEDNNQEKTQINYERKPIKIFINSFGGSVYDMWALIDIIINSKTPIYTYCTGYAMSAGFNIFLAGHKRYVTKNSTLLYHTLSCWLSGKYQDLVEDMEERHRNQKDIEDYVFERTNITRTKLEEIREKKIDWYIHSEEVEILGIAEVIENLFE